MPSVGDVTVDARINGDRWPSDLRRIMRQVGRQLEAAGEQHGAAYSDRLRRQLGTLGTAEGKSLGARLSAGFRSSVQGLTAPAIAQFRQLSEATGVDTFDGFRRAADGVRDSLRDLGDEIIFVQGADGVWREETAGHIPLMGARSRATRELTARTRELGDSSRESSAFARAFSGVFRRWTTDADNASGASSRLTRSTTGLGTSWRDLSHNTRQWTLIIGSVIAGMSHIAVLGSALGGTIVALGTAFVGAGAGIAVAVAGFRGLYDETIKLTPAAQAAKDAFSELGGTLNGVQGSITNAMFADMAPSIQAFRDQVSALEPFIASFAGVVGQNISKIFDALASPQAFETFKALLEGFKPIFSSLTDAAIGFGSGLGGVMVAALPTAQRFAEAIADVGRRFGEWANSEEGRERIREWFETAEAIMPRVMDLLFAAGQAIAGLVTPQSIASTQGLLDSLTGFMPALEGILGIFGNLNIFGVIAAALDAFGGALMPLMGPLQNLASLISTALIAGLQALAPWWTTLANLIAPLIDSLVGFLEPILTKISNEVLPVLVGALMQVAGQFQPVIAAVQGLLDALAPIVSFLIDALLAAFQFVWPAIQAIIQVVIDAIVGAINGLTTFFQGLVDFVSGVFSGNWEQAWTGIQDMVKGAIEFIWNFIQLTFIGKLVTGVKTALTGIGSFFKSTWDDIVNWVSTAIKNVQKVITDIVTAISDWWHIIWTRISVSAQVIWNQIRAVVDGAVNGVRSVIQTVIGAVKGWWDDTLKAFENTARDVWNNVKNAIKGPIDAIKGFIKDLSGPINDAIGWFKNLFGAADKAQGKANSAAKSGGKRGGMASGGRVYGPTRALIGEAGPEAVVPLSRPLSQVDPSVRWLSAIAQGKYAPQAMASGGVASGSQVSVAPGAIQIIGSIDPRRTAIETVDRMVERIA